MIDKDDLTKALTVLKEGGVILYPTDTVWGLGCDATNSTAIKRIFDIKKRSDAKALISLVDSEGMLQRTVKFVPDAAWQLLDVAVNPLTIIYDEPIGLAPELLAEDGSAAIRVSHEPISRSLCQRLRKPLVSTSANISGQKTPSTFAEISREILEAVDYVMLSGRDYPGSKQSNIIKVKNNDVIKVIR